MNCDDNKDQTLTVLGLVWGDRSCGLRVDGVAEDMILLNMLIEHICSGVSGDVISQKWDASSGRLPMRYSPKGFPLS